MVSQRSVTTLRRTCPDTARFDPCAQLWIAARGHERSLCGICLITPAQRTQQLHTQDLALGCQGAVSEAEPVLLELGERGVGILLAPLLGGADQRELGREVTGVGGARGGRGELVLARGWG